MTSVYVCLRCQDNKKSDTGQQIEEARSSVSSVTSQIDLMRVSRDTKRAEIDALQKDAQVKREAGW